ncbi:MAG TPA: T9SS type A sorting domain-containing protein, partial [Saprospiraceae bacterium]|nr:T9SS type A sorting domain-containing protein [Saprospiraceae bacterium]
NPGYCGPDNFIYIVQDTLNIIDTATVSITVKCAASYPVYSIAQVTTNNNLGVADSLGVYCQIKGIVYGNDFQGGTNIQFYMIDNTGGISVFSNDNFGYTVKEGDEVIVRGQVDQFSGLTQMTPDTLWKVSSANPLKLPKIITALDETTESEFVKFNLVRFKDKSQWTTGVGTGFNVDILDVTGNSFSMRIDNDVDLFNQAPPGFTYFRLTGIGSQFDNTSPFTSGYQILPRYMSDIEGLVGTTDPGLDKEIILSPNPSSDKLTISTKLNIEKASVMDVLGNILLVKTGLVPNSSIDISQLSNGIYFIKYEIEGRNWVQKFVKN